MKKILVFIISVTALCSCQFSDEDFQVQAKPRTMEMDVEAFKKYMSIDTIANQYTANITEEQRVAEGISKENLLKILCDIDAVNSEIKQDVEAGEVVTLFLSNKDDFKSYTIDSKHVLGGMKLKDTRISENKTRAGTGKHLGWGHFSGGNWQWKSVKSQFEGGDHVTSMLSVASSKGFWQVNFVCKTGTSSYGTKFRAYGTGSSHGTINRYWWWTDGGSAPFKWNFDIGGAPGGEAYGSLDFYETK